MNESLIKSIVEGAWGLGKAAVDAIRDLYDQVGKEEAKKILTRVAKSKKADISELKILLQEEIKKRKERKAAQKNQ